MLSPHANLGSRSEYLVNNAGFGVFGYAIERDRAEQLNIIAVNIRALTDLSLRFGAAASSTSVRSQGLSRIAQAWRSITPPNPPYVWYRKGCSKGPALLGRRTRGEDE